MEGVGPDTYARNLAQPKTNQSPRSTTHGLCGTCSINGETRLINLMTVGGLINSLFWRPGAFLSTFQLTTRESYAKITTCGLINQNC